MVADHQGSRNQGGMRLNNLGLGSFAARPVAARGRQWCLLHF
jgi:hypothetical protein